MWKWLFQEQRKPKNTTFQELMEDLDYDKQDLEHTSSHIKDASGNPLRITAVTTLSEDIGMETDL